ncbi:MAG: sel1 repeat family protein [Campylobacteraceae bacterium]|nr:sel1 repeat family protein [Campylobacteraceae bacterium]
MRVLTVFFFSFFLLFASDSIDCSKNPGACHNLAVAYYGGEGVEQNLPVAYSYFKKACDNGFLQSCFNVGLMSLNGDGTAKDEFIAFDMFKKTCVKDKKEYKTSDGCINLAMLYIDGKGVRQDFKKGLEILDDACKAGVLQSCKGLASIYESGYLAIEANSTKALDVLKYDCDKNKNAESCSSASSKFFKESNGNDGISYLEKACKFGLADACISLGLMYTNAQFVEQNLSSAKEYFGKACDLKSAKGCESYKVLNMQEIEDARKNKK